MDKNVSKSAMFLVPDGIQGTSSFIYSLAIFTVLYTDHVIGSFQLTRSIQLSGLYAAYTLLELAVTFLIHKDKNKMNI